MPPEQSDLARELLKDPYTFDFITLANDAVERGLVRHIEKFLLELGVGFAFVGRQVRLDIGGDEYAVDLLCYHLRLRCFLVIDLKMKPFKPPCGVSFQLAVLEESQAGSLRHYRSARHRQTDRSRRIADAAGRFAAAVNVAKFGGRIPPLPKNRF